MDSQLYAFATPLLLGLSALFCVCEWCYHRQHRYLLWLCAFLVLLALGLTAQLLMPITQRFQYVIYTTSIYLLAVACLAHAMVQRMQQRLQWIGVVLISGATLAGMWYFSHIDPSMPSRLVVLSLGAAAIKVQVLWCLRHRSLRHALDRISILCYALMACALLLRPLLLLLDNNDMSSTWVSEHISWGFTSVASMVLCSILAVSLCGSALMDSAIQLRQERDQDNLTGLLTRRAFYEICGHTPYLRGFRVMVFADLDHFKRINDHFGHSTGDEVLHTFGQLLRTTIHGDDVAARIGGEEFVFALAHTTHSEALHTIARIQHAMQHTVWSQLRVVGPVTASFGMVEIHPQEPLEKAMHRADVQLYSAKEAGRNCVMTAFHT